MYFPGGQQDEPRQQKSRRHLRLHGPNGAFDTNYNMCVMYRHITWLRIKLRLTHFGIH